MKALQALLAITVVITTLSLSPAALAAPQPAQPWIVIDYPAHTQGIRLITDTLGGKGHPRQISKTRNAVGKRPSTTFITDTLAGDGHPRQINNTGHALPERPSTSFITDTLGGSGHPRLATVAEPGHSFNWADAGIGAATALGTTLLLFGATLAKLRQRGWLAA